MRNQGYAGTRWRNRGKGGGSRRTSREQLKARRGKQGVGGERGEKKEVSQSQHETTETSVDSHLGSKET